MNNLQDFARLVRSVLADQGTTHRHEQRFRTAPHGTRRMRRRKVSAVARQARRLNRTDKHRRSLPAAPRTRR